MLGDLDQRQAGMLFVVGAQAAIIGATEFGMPLEGERPVARLDELLAQAPIGCVRRHKRGLDAMLLAALFVPDLVVEDLDLGRHQLQAGLAERLGLAPEDIGARLTQRRVHAWVSLWAPSPA